MSFRKYKYYYLSLVFVGLVITAAAVFGYSYLAGSKPMYEGELKNLGFSSAVTIERDGLGIAVITGESRFDVSHALGFAHGQERFFQMDLLRRSAAGELAELFGHELVEYDAERRLHQFRKRAKVVFENLSVYEKKNLEAYVQGVNQGLKALSARPVEYALINENPVPWLPEDSLLVAYAMYFDLQDANGTFDISRGIMQRLIPEEIYAYLTDHETEWRSLLLVGEHQYADFPVDGSFDYLQGTRMASSSTPSLGERHLGGSNQWAVRFESEGRMQAILANDMHLGLGVPNLWFRTSLKYKSDGALVNVNGVTLPGLPVMIIGSNGKVSWGYTNSQINLDDVFVLNDIGNGQYMTHAGPRSFDIENEVIRVKDEAPQQLEIRKTPYGPVLLDKFFGNPVAFRWVAHHKDSVNLNHFRFETVNNVDQAIEVSRTVKMPTMNFMLADHLGNIAWTLIGPIPGKRDGYTGLIPVELMSLANEPSLGLLDASEYPTVINPESGMLWTANNQTVSGELGDLLGDGAYVNGSRAQQIQKRLANIESPTIENMFAIQLDDEALFLKRWHQLLLKLVNTDSIANIPPELVDAVKNWNGHASVDSVAYYVVREFRMVATTDILTKLLQECKQEWDGFDMVSFDYEEPVWSIIEQKVRSVLDEDMPNWNAQLTAYLNTVVAPFREDNNSLRLADMRWGLHNKAEIQHPLSQAVPFLSSWLDAPADPLRGDYYMPLIARPSIGASQRMVVMPGNEQRSLFHMPGGQSGHTLSPFYLKGHEDWVTGKATPLLPGKTQYLLTLN